MAKNIEGNLQQLLEEVESWPDGKVNWSEKARAYKIRTKGQESTPANGGQMVKEFLQSKGVNIDRFEPSANNYSNQEGCSGGNNYNYFSTEYFLSWQPLGGECTGRACIKPSTPPPKSQIMGLSHGAMGTSCLYCN